MSLKIAAGLNPEHESQRLGALLQFQLLDTETEKDFDEIVALASELCETPVAMVGLVDSKRIWIKSKYGIDIEEVHRDVGFCHYTIQQTDVFVVPDTRQDKRFFDNPLVTGAANIQFYAGVPLLTEDGYAIGTLCVTDTKPRELSKKQLSILQILAKQVETLLKLKLKILKLDESNKIIKANKEKLRESEQTLATYFNSSNDAVFLIQPNHIIKSFNKLAEDYIQDYFGKKMQVGDSIFDYVEKSSTQFYLDNFGKAMSGQESRVEIKVPHHDSSIWWATSYLPTRELQSNEITGVILVTKNIDKRKKAEEALLESKQLISDIANNLPNGVIYQYILEEDGTHRFPYVSSGATKLYGFSIEDIILNPNLVFDVIYNVEEAFREAILVSKENLTDFDFQYQILVDGKLKWLHTKSKPKRLPRGATQWDGLTIEITEQKKSTELLEKTKQELQDVLNTLPDLLFRFDKENKYAYIHATRPEDLFLPREQLLGKRIKDILPEQFADLIIQHLDKARKTDKIVILEYALDLPSQGPTWFEGRMVKTDGEEVLMIVRNITERKIIEDALQKSEANLSNVFDNTDVGYYLFDQNLNIVSFNTPAQEFTIAEFHKPLEIGNYFFDYFPEEYKERLKGAIAEVMNGKKIEYERHFTRANGEEKWYYTKYVPVFDKNKQIVGMVMSTEHITERKANENQLKKSFELATEQNKRLLNFSYIVSHNLRSHTSNIKSILDILDYVDSEEEKAEMMQLLKKVSNALNETIYELNDVVSIHANLNNTIESLNLSEYVKKTILVLGEQINAKNAIVQNLLPQDLMINYTPAYLDSIIFNFVSNAIKYSHPDRQPIVAVSCRFEKDMLVLEIKDNGIGIDLEKNGDKLFGMYKTFNDNKDARGIGLFITKNQIEAMGGKVLVQSELGIGSTFSIYIKWQK